MERAIFAGSTDTATLSKLWNTTYSALDDVNKSRYLQDALIGKTLASFRYTCTRCVVATDHVLNGKLVQALPHPKPGALLTDVEHSLGGVFKQVSSYDQIVKEMRDAGEGARGVVDIIRPTGTAHVFNVIHDGNGVVFLDSQVAQFAQLEENLAGIMFNLYRK